MPVQPCANYLQYRNELETIDEILRLSSLDQFILDELLQERRKMARNDRCYQRGLESFIHHSRSAFRISILRAHKGSASVRDLEVTLGDSALEQWFCFIGEIDQIKAPSKSTVDRAKKHITSDLLNRAHTMLLQKAASAADCYDPIAEQALNLLGFEVPADLTESWYDLTCHAPNIHFPVDWVQLGDCCRTLLKAIRCIRKHGIKNRMPRGGADKLLRELNQLLIAFGNARRRKDSKKQRKSLLRRMKKFADRMARHARTHRDLLETQRAEKTELSAGQAEHIIGRIDHVLELLPQAKKQAHERIIGERRVLNADKILSIYEPSTKVIKRGKSGAEVEYGHQLLIGENREGLILHWRLYQDVLNDSKRLSEAVDQTEQTTATELKKIVTDRGMSDRKVQQQLRTQRPNLIDHICPRSVVELEQKKRDPDFCVSQKRRAQTEARIAILTNSYQRGRSLSKGLESQRQELRWVVLAHNLRKLASRLIAERHARQERQRAA